MSTEKTVNTTEAAAAAPAETPVQDEGFRVYIGNLSFKATEDQVREFAKQSGGEPISVILPSRFKRPGGFAFVHFKTEEEANTAVEKLNDTEFDGRKVRLQVARSREEQAARRESILEKRNAAREEREKAKAEKKEKDGAEGDQEGAASVTKTKKKRNPKKAGRRRAPGSDSEELEGETTAVGEASDAAADGEKAKPKKKNTKARKAREARIDDGAEETDGAKEKKASKPKGSQRKLQLSEEQSPNTIFVANLPFSVDDEALAAIFTNLSIEVKTAKVVVGLRRPRGSKPFRASRGFGFVEISDSTQQKEAVEKVEGTLVGDRKITAKIANEMKPIEQAEVNAATVDAENVPAQDPPADVAA